MGGFVFEFSLVMLALMLAAVLFTGWLAFVVVRGGIRGVGYLMGGRRSLARQIGIRQCARLRCGAFNPDRANFCRRCGSSLKSSGRINGPIAA